MKDYRYFAGNQWRRAADDQFFEVHEPYSGELFARVAAGSRADARTAVDAAAKAFPSWADSTPAERASLFLKASEIVKRRKTEIAEILARETGSTISIRANCSRKPSSRPGTDAIFDLGFGEFSQTAQRH